MNLLIIKHGALGDVVRTSYFLPGLIRKFGESSHIYWLTSKAATDLLRYNPYIYKIVTNSTELNDTFFDCVISLDDEHEAAATASRVNRKELIGACLEKGKLSYTPDSAPWFDMGLISRYGKEEADRRKKDNSKSHAEIFSTILGIKISRGYFYNSLVIEQQWLKRAARSEFRIGINPFAGGRWPAKALCMQELRKLVPALLGYRIAGRPVRVYFFGEGDGQQRLKELAGEHRQRVDVLDTSTSVLDFAAAIKCMEYLITSDSLALHLAISQGIPNLSFYAPTSSAEIDTFGTGVKICSTSPDYCSYRKDADNSTVTTDRLLDGLYSHVSNLNLNLTTLGEKCSLGQELYSAEL